MFMISSADFTVSLLGRVGASAPLTALQEGPQPRDAVRQTESCRADLMAASGHFSCPPPGSFVAVSGQFLVSAVIFAPRLLFHLVEDFPLITRK